jgi:hypothetical protein
MIEHITLQGMNTRFNTGDVAFNEKNDLNTQDGLLKEYGKLQIQLKQLKLLEKRMKKQLEVKHIFTINYFLIYIVLSLKGIKK